MRKSGYPRAGERIAPLTLREILAAPVRRDLVSWAPGRPLQYCDLDESVWDRFDAETCQALAEALVQQVRAAIPSLPRSIRNRGLPVPRAATTLDDLELDTRTHNALARAGFRTDRQTLGSTTIGDVLTHTSGLGAKALVELLTRLEALRSGQGSASGEESTARFASATERLRLPERAIGARLEDLGLEKSTYDSLCDAGFGERPRELGAATVAQLLRLPGFGAWHFADLLGALQSFVASRGAANVLGMRVEDLGLCETAKDAPPGSAPECRLPDLGVATVGQLAMGLTRGAWRLDDLIAGVERRAQGAEPDHELSGEANEVLRTLDEGTVNPDDPRLGGLLRAIGQHRESLQDALQRLLARPRDPPNKKAILQNLRELRERIGVLSELRLEDELIGLAESAAGRHGGPGRPRRRPENERVDASMSGGRQRNAQIFAEYTGWDGRGRRTLASVANEAGLSRERVRQLCEPVVAALSGKKPFAPVLDRTLKVVASRVPRQAEDIELSLASEGLTRGPFRLEGLRHAAELLGRGAPFTIVTEGGRRFVVPRGKSELPSLIVQIVRRSVEHWGVTTVADVAARAEDEACVPMRRHFVTQVLEAQPVLQWLDQETGWFWLPTVPRNRLLNQMEKVLSVAGRLHVSELRAAVGRHHRMKGFAPPRRVLLELCRQLPGYGVEDDLITAEPPLEWTRILEETEMTIALVLKELGPVMTRENLENECLGLGMNRSTFYVYLGYSPILTKHARGVYSLVGTVVRPGAVETLLPRSRRRKVLVDYAWTSDARIWLRYRLSDAMIKTGVLALPTGLKVFLDGEFSLRSEDGSGVGTLVSRDGSAWGLGPFFRRRGGEPGDHMLIVFDLGAREAVVSVGDASVIDDLQVRVRGTAPDSI